MDIYLDRLDSLICEKGVTVYLKWMEYILNEFEQSEDGLLIAGSDMGQCHA
jgi:coenzyme F420-reducing hydrogenase delta subunit